MVQTNLRVLRPNRHKPAPGDVFVMRLPDDTYLFGRVVDTEMPRSRAPMEGANLVYVFRDRSSTKEPVRAHLRPDRLLLPPLFVNRMPWTKGYFEPVVSWPLEPGDLLDQHYFRDLQRGTIVDADENVVRRRSRLGPVGEWAMHSYRTFDDAVSDALGIPRVPEDD